TVGDAARAYLAAVGVQPQRACVAAAGPLIDGEVRFTNSDWVLRKSEMVDALGLTDLSIVNDFYALAAGVGHLGPADLRTVKDGLPVAGAPQLVIGPGTGLGQALIVPTPAAPTIVPTEGGHVAFAPRTDKEAEIVRFIAREHPRVSVERLLSGAGLVAIHCALRERAGAPPVSMAASAVTQAAIDGTDAIAAEAAALFCEILGRVAGDAVLATGARGGVFLGGGILPKIQEIFLTSGFVETFLDKGRMQAYVEATPVRLIVRDGAALYGAASALDARS
ncbi:MAG: glucokinase, partial [Pseudomonadota bacterium]